MSVLNDSLSLLWRLQPAAVQVLRACYYSNSVRHLTPPTTPYQVVVSPVALEIKRKLDMTFSQTVSDISIQGLSFHFALLLFLVLLTSIESTGGYANCFISVNGFEYRIYHEYGKLFI